MGTATTASVGGKDEYLSIEGGAGNAHWPANISSTSSDFEIVPKLGTTFLYGGADLKQQGTQSENNDVIFSSQTTLDISTDGNIKIKIYNNCVSTSGDKSKDETYSPSIIDGESIFELNLKLQHTKIL